MSAYVLVTHVSYSPFYMIVLGGKSYLVLYSVGVVGFPLRLFHYSTLVVLTSIVKVWCSFGGHLPLFYPTNV